MDLLNLLKFDVIFDAAVSIQTHGVRAMACPFEGPSPIAGDLLNPNPRFLAHAFALAILFHKGQPEPAGVSADARVLARVLARDLLRTALLNVLDIARDAPA